MAIARSNEAQGPAGGRVNTLRGSKVRGFALLGAGLFTLALLVMAGMGGVAPAAHADGPSPVAVKATPPLTRTPVRPAPGVLIAPCPAGTVLVILDQPVYDPSGLFVVGSKAVPYCIPVGLEPAG
jgi:hypothetical protein